MFLAQLEYLGVFYWKGHRHLYCVFISCGHSISHTLYMCMYLYINIEVNTFRLKLEQVKADNIIHI